jgi:hypothetical protein
MKENLTHEEKVEFLDSFLAAVKNISYGCGYGFGGLEGIAVAIAGRGLKNPIGESLNKIAESIDDHTAAIDNLADAIREFKGENK